MTSEVSKAVIAALKEITPNVYYGRSAAVYPKINIFLKSVEETAGKSRYALTLDFFTNDSSPSSAEALAESATAALSWLKGSREHGYIAIYKSAGGGFVDDKENEKISHYMSIFEIIYYKSKED